jgi:uncharacterized membrane protein (DUF4010 family)
MTADRVTTSFSNLVQGAQDLLSAARARRIIVRNTEKSVIIQAPLPVAVIVTIVASPIVAVGAVTALVLQYTLSIEGRQADKRNPSLEKRHR